ncbi:MAG: hypothetical protein ACI4KA_10370 [Oscillospiraceae bacterium]
MTKKFVIISGIIALAALAAGIVAYLLTRNPQIAECLEEDLDDFDAIDDEDVFCL